MGLFKKQRTENVEPLHDGFSQVVGENSTASTLDIHPIKTQEQLEDEKWEQRQWELTKYLVLQDRKSVVLGKLQASPRTIARKARELADATIAELRTNKPNNDNGRETDNKSL